MQRRRKKQKILIILGIVLVIWIGIYQFLLKKYYPISFFIENSEVVSVALKWDSMDTEKKKEQILHDIQISLSNNVNIDKKIKEQLMENYQKYIENYIQYYEKTDYLNTVLSSRYVFIEDESNSKQVTNILGTYDNSKKEITVYNTEALFHEKIHADRSWGLSILKNDHFYEEVYSSLISNDTSYEDIKSFFLLLNEILEEDVIEKSLFSKEYTQIWKSLKKNFPTFKTEIDDLEKGIKELYQLEYLSSEKTSWEIIQSKKEQMLKIYENLYQEKFQLNSNEDIIIGFLKYSFLSKNPFKNTNNLHYEQFQIADNLYISPENRTGSYEEYLIDYIINHKKDQTKYNYELWLALTNINDNSENKYGSFLNLYTPYFTEDETEEVFNQILNCTEKDYTYIAKYTIQKRNWRIENNEIF